MNAVVCEGGQGRVLGWKDVLRYSPRIGTAKGSSLIRAKIWLGWNGGL